MSALYPTQTIQIKAKRLHDSFYAYLSSLAQRRLPDGLEQLLKPLDRLPWAWWPSAATIALKAAHGGLEAVEHRLKMSLDVCHDFQLFGLHFHAKWPAISAACDRFNKIAAPVSLTPNEFVRASMQACEQVARELMIHHFVPGNERLTLPTRHMLDEYKTNLDRILKNTFLGRGLSMRTLAQIAANSWTNERRRAADFLHRTSEMQEFFVHDLGWFMKRAVVTAPKCFHASIEYGDLNPLWPEAGRPSPGDANQWLQEWWEGQRARMADAGYPVVGWWVNEAHGDGAPHRELVCFFKTQEAADLFDQHAFDLWHKHDPMPRASPGRGGFKKSGDQAYYSVDIDSDDNEHQAKAGNYSKKGVAAMFKEAETKATQKPLSGQQDAAIDIDWCRVESITQFQIFGLGKGHTGKWRLFQQLAYESGRDDLAPTLKTALLAASHDNRSYRTFLRLTHSFTPAHLRKPIDGSSEILQHIKIVNESPNLVSISGYGWSGQIIIQGAKWERIDRPFEAYQTLDKPDLLLERRPYLHLCISLPTTSGEPPPEPPEKPPKKRFSFKRP